MGINNKKFEGLENLKFNKKDNEFTGNIIIDKFNLNCEINFDVDVQNNYVEMCINYVKKLPDEIFKEICNLLTNDCNYYSKEYNEIELPQNITGEEIIKYISNLSMQIYNHPKQDIIGFCICGNCVWNSEHGFIIVINNGKIVHFGENDNLYYPWEFEKNRANNGENKDKITREEYDKLFEKDQNGCYVRLIIPAIDNYPEMNLIGKNPSDYTLDEIIHSKKFRQFMYKKIIDNNELCGKKYNENIIGRSIDKIKLGMKQSEVNSLISNLKHKKTIPYGYSKEIKCDYNNEYQIWYDENDSVNFIMCYIPDKIVINGKKLNVEMNYNELLEFVKQNIDDVEENDSGFISNKLGFGVSVDYNNENQPFIKSVQVVVKNFWINESKVNHPKQNNKDKVKNLVGITLFGMMAFLMFIFLMMEFAKEHYIVYLLVSVISLICALLCFYTPIYELFRKNN